MDTSKHCRHEVANKLTLNRYGIYRHSITFILQQFLTVIKLSFRVFFFFFFFNNRIAEIASMSPEIFFILVLSS